MNKPLQAIFAGACRDFGLPAPEFELEFHPTRKWRFDIAWPDKRVAVEVEGGVWSKGRHVRGSGFIKDMEKYNAAVALGWRILRYVPNEVCNLDTLTQIQEVLHGRTY